MLELEYARGRLMARPGYVRSAPRGKERKGQLYLLLDLEGEAAPEQSRRWEGRLADIFYRHPSGSITSALLRALQDVNEEIVAANQTVPDDEVCQAAVAGAVVRDDEVYFALVGRTVAFLDGPDGCDVLGRGEARPGERPLDSLGAAEDVEIQMFHRVIGEPWTIVLASSGALALRGATQALEANPTAPVAALRRLAESARPARPFTGIVVSSAGEEVDEETTDDDEDGGFGPRPDLDDSPERRGPRERRARFHDAPANRAARVTSAPVARHPSHPRPIEEDAEPDWEEIARSRRDGLGEPRSPVPQRTRGVVESREEPGPDLTPGCPLGPPSRAREGGTWTDEPAAWASSKSPMAHDPPSRFPLPARGKGARGLGPVHLPDNSVPHPYDHASWTEPDDEDWDEDGEDGGILAEVVAVARRVVTARIGRRRLGLEDDPEIDDARSDARGGFRRESGFGWTRFLPRGGVLDPLDPLQFALLGVIVVALFLAGYLVVVVPVRLIQNGAAYADAIGKISQAEQTEHTAMSENDPNTRRQLLDQAATLAAAAHNEQPQSATIAATEARIRDEYKAASGADSFGTPIRLVDLPAPGDRLIAKGVNLFVLDQTDSRLYRYLMNADGTTAQTGGNPVVVQRGDHLGLITVGQLTRMAWVPGANSGNAALVVLDSAGFLIRYATDSGLSLLALHDPTTWGDVSALAASTDTLYAARSTADTLTAYTAQPSGYDGTAQNALAGDNRPNLSDVSALAADGDLFVVRQNGALLRLAGGEVASDTPDTTKLFAGPPAGLAVAGSALFVGDPRGDRIVQLSRAGEFQRYLTAGDNSDVLGQVRDLAVSADGTALYALTNDAIYRLPLPIQSS